jgi:hypothetical protein
MASGGAHRKGRRPDKQRVGFTKPPLEQRRRERRKVNAAAKQARKLNRAPKQRRR